MRESSFSSQLAIIWGPPGTGKTKTIATAIEAHLNAGRRVLLVSHANNAVDEALEDVADQLKANPLYLEGKLVRLGKPQEEHLKILEFLNEVALDLRQDDNSYKQFAREIEEDLKTLDEALASIRAKTAELQKVPDNIALQASILE